MDLDIRSLKESVDFLNDLYANVTTAIFLADGDARIRHFNDAFRALFQRMEGDTIGALCGDAIGCCFPIDEGLECGETSHCGACALRTDVIKSFTERVPVYKDSLSRDFLIDGKRRRMYFSFTTKYEVYRDMEYVLVLVDDVTAIEESRLELAERNADLARHNRKLEELLRAEAFELMARARELERLGLERESLVREVHHRVGNNLQVISSLLDLGRKGGSEGEELASLRSRINAVIEVYRHLVYDEGAALVRAQDLVRAIVGEAPASILVELPTLAFDLAIPLGIVLGEFLSACHDDGEAAPADLQISLAREGEGGILRVEGRNLRAQDPIERGGEGIDLARLLASQIDGRITLRRSEGDAYCLTMAEFAFPL